MEGMSYIPGLAPETPGPLSRFLPPLEDGTVAAWLSRHVEPSSWLLDPFGFSPRLPVEAARAGYRVLATVNNPVTRFLLELAANPPSEADFNASLAELAASRKGDERLETNLQSLYLTRCEKCKREIQATAFLWRKGEEVPFARLYECKECGDQGEREATQEDLERARKISETDTLHRSRALERVAARDDPERPHVHEALESYLPRPLYALTTIISRLEGLSLTPERLRALTGLVLVACDAGNSLWAHPEQRPRPKQISTPEEFLEHNVWMMLERGRRLCVDARARVTCVAWPSRIPDAAGICVYDGRLKSLAEEVKKEIPIAAVIASVPRPNQAFWTFSALWAGWLWGRDAVEPYRVALQRRRYDWAWNATALHAAFTRLSNLLGLGTQFFGLLPEVEPAFMRSAMIAINAAGFELKGLALRTENDPVQFVWERGERLRRTIEEVPLDRLRHTIRDHLAERGEPTSFLHLQAAALEIMAEKHALRREGQDFDAALRETQTIVESMVGKDENLFHHSTGDSVEAGLWGLRDTCAAESLTDRTEVVIVNYLQKNPGAIILDVENEVYRHLTGLLTPSLETIHAVLSSYAVPDGSGWKLRSEDSAASRQNELRSMSEMVEKTGLRLKYQTRRAGKWLLWEERGSLVFAFAVLASSIVTPVLASNPHPAQQSILVIPGGRAGLIAFKTARDPALAKNMNGYRLAKFRLWRSLADVGVLTRETFEEQLSSDPIERAMGQMIMF